MGVKIEDLDVLRPEPKFVRIGGKDIDVSFVPCGITFDVDAIIDELNKMNPDNIKNDISVTKKAFELSIKLCSVFCSHKYPELDEEWFYDNTDAGQIKLFTDNIREALERAYAGINNDNSKNRKASRKKNP